MYGYSCVPYGHVIYNSTSNTGNHKPQTHTHTHTVAGLHLRWPGILYSVTLVFDIRVITINRGVETGI